MTSFERTRRITGRPNMAELNVEEEKLRIRVAELTDENGHFATNCSELNAERIRLTEELRETSSKCEELIARLQLVAETPDLKRARKRIAAKTEEVAAIRRDLGRVMQNSNIAVANVLNTVKEICRIGAMTARSGPDEDRLRTMCDSLPRIPLPYILSGQVQPKSPDAAPPPDTKTPEPVQPTPG